MEEGVQCHRKPPGPVEGRDGGRVLVWETEEEGDVGAVEVEGVVCRGPEWERERDVIGGALSDPRVGEILGFVVAVAADQGREVAVECSRVLGGGHRGQGGEVWGRGWGEEEEEEEDADDDDDGGDDDDGDDDDDDDDYGKGGWFGFRGEGRRDRPWARRGGDICASGWLEMEE